MIMELENGDQFEVPEGMSVEQAFETYKKAKYKMAGVVDVDTKAAGEQAFREGAEGWLDKKSEGERRVASYQAGARDIGRNLLQMALPESMEARFGVSDPEMRQRQLEERPAQERSPGSFIAGQIIPTLAVPGGGPLRGGVQATKFAKAGLPLANALRTTLPRAAAEGAVFGAATGGPDNRGTGAVGGALAGSAGNLVARGLGKALGGIAPYNRVAKPVAEAGKKMGEEPFIPISRAGRLTGPGGLTRSLYDSILTNFPGSARMLRGQLDDVSRNAMENMIRKGYGDEVGGEVIRAFRQSDNLAEALKVGESMAEGAPGRIRNILTRAAENSTGTPSMREIAQASKRLYPGTSGEPLRKLAKDMQRLMGEIPKDEKNLGGRTFFQAAASILSGGGFNALAMGMATPGFQKFVMGRLPMQQAIAKALETGNMYAVQNTMEQLLRQYTISKAGDKLSEGAEQAASAIEGAF